MRFDFLDPQRFEMKALLQVVIVTTRLRFTRIIHHDIHIFENLARRYAQHAVVGLDQVVALATAMLASKMIGEAEIGGELFGSDQESCAIRLPLC